MDNNIFRSSYNQGNSTVSGAVPRTFMANVFSYMFAALTITGVIAYLVGSSQELFFDLFISQKSNGSIGPNALFWVVSLAPIGLVMLMSFAINRLSAMVMVILFVVYSALMGLSLSSIFMVYSMGSIATVFFITAGTFGAMALLGYTTKTDLTKFGSILYMALFGMIIAMLVNWFMQSSSLEWLISVIGVLVFTGLTAYDVQKLKEIGQGVGSGNETASKAAIMGALSLYLDFINLFLFLLRLLGNRNE